MGGVGNLNTGTSGGTILLTGVTNTYLGNTDINSGILGAAADGSLGTSGGSVNIGNGTFLAIGTFSSSRLESTFWTAPSMPRPAIP